MKRFSFLILGLFFLFSLRSLFCADKHQAHRALSNDSFYLYGDFLWWRADTSGVELALFKTKCFDGNASNIDKSTVELKGKWKPGFRVGTGYRFGHFDHWNLFLAWTRYRGKSNQVSKQAPLETGTTFQQGWISNFLGPSATAVKGSWDIDLDLLDLEMDRAYKITKQILLEPHVGVRGAWIDIDYRANYMGFWETADLQNDIFTKYFSPTSFRGKSDFSAGGLRVGTKFLWSVLPNLGFFGDVSLSLLYGRFKVEENFQGAAIDSSLSMDLIRLDPIQEKYTQRKVEVRPNLEILLGLKWSVDFRNGLSKFSIFAGYELSTWFQLNQLFRVVREFDTEPLNASNVTTNNASFHLNHINSNINFQGLTAKVMFDF
ncbi:MAG: Lpg1974 family pore-forming outer membrane protein [Chlamydiota bacterium]